LGYRVKLDRLWRLAAHAACHIDQNIDRAAARRRLPSSVAGEARRRESEPNWGLFSANIPRPILIALGSATLSRKGRGKQEFAAPLSGSDCGRLMRGALLLPAFGLYMCGDSFNSPKAMTAPLRLLPAALIGLFLLVPLASAQERRVPGSVAELTPSYAPVVQRVAPAVVNVYAAKVVENRNPFADDPFFRRFFGGPGLPREQVQRSLGSGVIVDASGLVVTNNHVIEGASEVKVALADKREFEAEVVLKDTRSDLAVLRLKGAREKFPALELGNSDELQVGDVVLAIGDPFGVGQTVTHGIVSALARTQIGITDYQFFIQTDAAINPGNSGGALVDINGRLIGINTAIFSRSGGSQGIGFAIPANMVRVVVTSAKGGSAAVKRPWLGARLQAVTPDLAEGLGLKRPIGALVGSVAPGSPAARAGLKTGDLILAVDGQPVDDPNAFDYRFATKPLGGVAQVGLLRGGKEARIAIALETAPDTRRDETVIRARSPFLGLRVANLSPALADELRIESASEGVAVVEVPDGSMAGNVGFRRGDLIVSVNGEQITSTQDLERVTKNPRRLWRITIQRGGQQISVVLSG
jgi:Do/DeqQ family serine protease